jgi:phosphate/sulfate permease
MILDALFNTVRSILEAIFSLLPDWHIDLPVAELHSFIGFIYGTNLWMPVSELGICFGIIVTIVLVLLLFRFVKWVVDSLNPLGGG